MMSEFFNNGYIKRLNDTCKWRKDIIFQLIRVEFYCRASSTQELIIKLLNAI